MWNWISGWRDALKPARRRKARPRRREQSPDLYPTLRVRMLEERRVFHADAIVAPAEAPPPPPPPTTTVTLDAEQNLLVQDVSAGGQNDQLRVRFDAEGGFYEITDATQLLHTDIEGASGSGTHQLSIPIAAVSGERLIFQTGAGDDSLSVDLSGGLGGKSLHFDGGAGAGDSLTLLGGSYSTVGYVLAGDGSTQIDAGVAQLQLTGVEPILDYLAADSRQFTLGVGLEYLSLGDDGIAANDRSLASTSLGSSVTFASPLHSLSLAVQGDGSGQSLHVTGLDAEFAGDLHVYAGDQGQIAFSGTIDLAGGDLSATGDTIQLSGSIATSSATIAMSARSSLTVTADGVIDNSGGQVLLDAGAEGTLQFSGRIDARGMEAGQAGGTVHLLGWQVELLGAASVDVSGAGGGGTVLVGGDYQGLNPLVRRATNTLVQADVSIHANGLGSADGGKIIVWADEAAVVAGSGNLQARGGEHGGDGGLIETSGKQYLEVRGAADASSPYGTAGTWLLDPVSLSIVTISLQTLDGSGSFTSSSGNTTIAASTIVTALQGTDGTNGTNVTINTGSDTGGAGNIDVDEEISVALGAMTTRTLTLNAHGTIDVNKEIKATAGMLNVVLNADLASAGGDISLDAAITTNGGSFSTAGDTFENTDAIISTSGGNVTLNHTGAVTISANMVLGAGTATIDGSSIAFSTTVAATLSAQIANLTASGAITSGMATNDIVVSGMAAAISLSGSALGTSGSPLQISPGAGTVALTASTGGIFIDVTAGDFTTEQITTLSAAASGAAIVLRALGGDLEIDKVSQFNANTANDQFTLTSTTGDVILSAPTALAASTVAVTATTGDILATTAGPHLAASGTGTAITLTSAGKIGGSGAAVGVQAGAGTVTATTTSTDAADGVYLASTGALQLGAIVTNATAMQTVVVTTTGMDAHLTIAAASSTNDDWTLTSSGNIAFGASGQLTAKSASLSASGAVTGSSGTATDIDTSTANGAITLSGTSLGASGQPLQLRPGTGTLDLTASTGGVFVNLDAGDLLSSRLSLDVQGAGQTIALSTTDGAITFDSTANFVATSDDNFVVAAGGTAKNVAFSGMTTLAAHSVSLTASGAIVSGAATTDVQTAATGTLALVAGGDVGASGNELLIQAGGAISATAGGDIYLRHVTGNLATSAFTTLTSTKVGAIVSIGTLAGSVSVDSVTGFALADDTLEIVAGGMGSNISFSTTLSAGIIRLNAAGNIASTAMSSAADVSAASGIELSAGGGIGAAGNPLVVQTTAGTITATTAGAGAAGSIYLESPVALPLGGITTDAASTQTVSLHNTTGNLTIGSAVSSNDDWILDSAGNIPFGPLGSLTANSATLTAGGTITGSSGTTTDIDTSAANGAVSLTANSLGASTAPLQLSVGTGNLALTARTGGVFVNLDAGELRTSRLALNVQTANQTIALSTSAGGVAVDSVAGFTNTADDDFQITAGGSGQDVAFSGLTTLVGRSIVLAASGDITSGDAAVDVDTSALGGVITLSAGGDIGAAGNELRFQSGGLLSATADGDIFLRQASGDLATSKFAVLNSTGVGSFVSIGTVNGLVTVDTTTGLVVADDTLEIVAGNAAGSLGDIAINATLAAAAVRLIAAGSIQSGNAAPIDINTSILGGDITLVAGGPIGSSLAPIFVSAGAAGDVSATTSGASGDIYLTSVGPLRLNAISTDAATSQTVSLATTGGDFTIAAASTTNDNWILNSSANIAFSGPGSLSAASANLTATGQITSGTANIDIDTAAFNGPITLSAASIGAAGNSLVINAANAPLSVTASSGDVHLTQWSGDLVLSQFTTLSLAGNNVTLDLLVRDGNLLVNQTLNANTQNDQLQLSAAGAGGFIAFLDDPTFQPVTLIGSAVTLTATADILNFSSFPGVPNIDTSAAGGSISLAGRSLGMSGLPLQVRPGTGDLNLVATSGGVFVNLTSGDLNAAQLSVSAAGANQTLAISTTNGHIELSGASFAANTADDSLVIQAGGAASDVTFNGTPIVAGAARIVAGDSIISTQTGTDAMVAGLLELVATLGGIGAAGGTGGTGNAFTFTAAQLITQSAGPQYLQQPQAADQTIVVSAQSGGDIFPLRGGYLVSGDITSLGTVTIAPSVLLGGSGTVAGSAIVVAGIVDPGYFPGTMTTDGDAEALTLVGSVTVTRDATLIFDINPPYMTPGTDYDHLIVFGTLVLETPELELKGGRQLQQSINGIELVSATNPVMGMFEITGSVIRDGRTGGIKAVVGSFRGDLIFNGPAGNGIVIGDLSLVPPIQQLGVRLPAIRLPVFTRIDRPLPAPVPPPPLTPPSEPPPLEAETEAPKLRELEVRIVIPIDDAGNFREQVVMKLPAEMLTDLPALFRRLPDDRYRIYLMLEGSAEERLVIDVLVRDGRPMEPGDVSGEAASEALPLPADPHADPRAAPGPAALPELPVAPRPATPPAPEAGDAAGAQAPARLFAGVGLAAAAIVASRAAPWSEQVDEAAEQIGRSGKTYWRWWRRSAPRQLISQHN